MGQTGRAGDIANGKNVRNRGFALGVDLDKALIVDLKAQTAQIEAIAVAGATHGDQNGIEGSGHLLTGALEGDRHPIVLFGHLTDAGVEPHVFKLFHQPWFHHPHQILINARQQGRALFHKADLAPQCRIKGGQFKTYIAGPDHQQ